MELVIRFAVLCIFTALWLRFSENRWKKHSIWLMAGYFFAIELIFLL